MDGFQFPALGPVAKRVAPLIGAVVIAGAGIGYALHEHNNAQSLAAKNEQSSAQLDATRMQLDALTAKVNALAASNETNGGARPTSSSFSTGTETSRRAVTHRASGQDSRFKKLQSQLDAQGKEIDETRSDLANTHTDLTNTRTELSGSIARTHDELVMLEKKGERNYFEVDISKSKQFKREGPVGISLRKANEKRGYADLMLMVDDRNLQQKHLNLYQPSMFYESDSPQPIEIVINDVTKDHIHGYVSAPKYRRSELAAMSSGGANPGSSREQAANSGQGDNGIVGQPASSTDQPASTNTQPAVRQKLTLPDQDPSQH
jgi:hypothetical protein